MTRVPRDRADAACRTPPGIAPGPCCTASGWTTRAPWRRSRGCTRACGYLADPHTAIGIAAARALPAGARGADGGDGDGAPGEIPRRDRARHRRSARRCRRALADLFTRAERFTVVANETGAVRDAVRTLAGRNTG